MQKSQNGLQNLVEYLLIVPEIECVSMNISKFSFISRGPGSTQCQLDPNDIFAQFPAKDGDDKLWRDAPRFCNRSK